MLYTFNKYTKQFLLVATLFFATVVSAQINFAQSDLNFGAFATTTEQVTSLTFGPDDRLYVIDRFGTFYACTIQRNAANDYEVIDQETITAIKDIPNHDDNGDACSGTTVNCNERQATGLAVSGTATNPILYVTSSDARIGGGDKGDVNLDTNSGIITRLTWTGSTWDVVDLVRGLPRSEENHATNGLEFITVNGVDYLIVAQGGHANAGSPSKKFAYTGEYALSAAILSVNLTQLNTLTVSTDATSGRKYIYDIPTLDDPNRGNVNGITDPNATGYNGIDINDPFGGNDGQNQAMIIPNGPVQIFSPGYRNPYDLVVTENGAVYTTDNGANGTWGGLPKGEGTANVSNDYDATEPGGTAANAMADGEYVDNHDHLQFISNNINTYTFGSYYGGHANPIRANPTGAGLYTAPQTTGIVGAVFRTLKYDPDGSTTGSTTDATIALPANWPPVSVANTVENDWRGPGQTNPDGPDDNPMQLLPLNTNGIDEYTASNFGGVLKGNLILSSNNGRVHRVELKADGTKDKYTQDFLKSGAGYILGISCNNDNEIFPGTIWLGTSSGVVKVLEPVEAATISFPLRINAGGPEIIDSGNTFIADQYYDAGTAFTSTLATTPDLYKTERYDADKVLDYTVPVSNGDYTVILHFAEIYLGVDPAGTGQRIFDVAIEGNTVLDNYDIVADVGADTPTTKTFNVTVADGELNINFSSLAAAGGMDSPKVSAIEILVNGNVAPNAVAVATPATGIGPLEVTFSGSDSTDDTGVTGYSWDFKDNSALVTTANPTHTFANIGVYEVELTVEDAEGLTDTTTVTVTVTAKPNEAPKAVLSASSIFGATPLTVNFTGDTSTDDVAVTGYAWDFKDGTTSTDANPEHTFTTVGTYVVSLTVSDVEGLQHTKTVTITVSDVPNVAPVAVISATPEKGTSPLEVVFSGTSSTDDYGVTAYEWDFNDGSALSTEASPTHTYTNVGVYNVTLTVTDANELTNSATISIVVIESNTNNTNVAGKIIVNPAKEVAQVSLLDNGFGDQKVLRVYLHDATGRLIATYLPSEIVKHGLYEIPVTTLENGVYHIGFKFVDGEKMVLPLIVNQ